KPGVAELLGDVLAEISVREGDLLAAIEYLQAALTADPGLHYARFRLAEVYQRQGRLDEALRYYEEVLASENQNLPALLNRVRMLQELGRLPEARQRAEELVEQAPRDASARIALALILKQVGEAAMAERQLETAIGLEAAAADTALAHYNLGVLLDQRHSGREAARHYAMALDLDPELLEARFQLAVSLARASRMQDAAQLFSEVIERRPDHLDARLGLATARVMEKRYASARAVLEEGVRIAPDNVTLVHTLALLLAACPEEDVRDGARAAELALAAFEAQPTLQHGETLAISLAEAGDFAAAVSWQARLVEEAAGVENEALATRLQANLERYRRGMPAISPWASPSGS
ncbi:MAG: tetratricopeptide repeat protein, partial [Thermoanaerobaculia bacterium]